MKMIQSICFFILVVFYTLKAKHNNVNVIVTRKKLSNPKKMKVLCSVIDEGGRPQIEGSRATAPIIVPIIPPTPPLKKPAINDCEFTIAPNTTPIAIPINIFSTLITTKKAGNNKKRLRAVTRPKIALPVNATMNPNRSLNKSLDLLRNRKPKNPIQLLVVRVMNKKISMY
ncbi:hypothetical protein [Peribacillus simplex]|uniref:hypothetical protein n=1 Tax=Peribacillus simplex TaxID=1478 RepID=UPI0011A118ED|nr:hypothetical protein [Peribacillus simplex]